MDRKQITEARMAYESAGCALENTICEYLSAFGEKGVDITGFPIEAEYTGTIAGERDVTLSAVRYSGDTLEGCGRDGEWFAISAFNRRADYGVYAGQLAAALEL